MAAEGDAEWDMDRGVDGSVMSRETKETYVSNRRSPAAGSSLPFNFLRDWHLSHIFVVSRLVSARPQGVGQPLASRPMAPAHAGLPELGTRGGPRPKQRNVLDGRRSPVRVHCAGIDPVAADAARQSEAVRTLVDLRQNVSHHRGTRGEGTRAAHRG